MANISRYLQEGRIINHTPAAAIYAGNIIEVDAMAAFTPRDVAASAVGAVSVAGVIRTPFDGLVAGNVGDNVWWDSNGNPYDTVTADGAATLAAASGNFWIGTLVAPVAAAATECDVALNQVNPNLPAWQNKTHNTTAIDLTYVAATHNGEVIHVTVDAKTVTMPVGVAGMEAIIVNDVADGGALLTVDFNGAETLEGALAIAGTKTALNTKATQIRGDFLHIRCQTAASLWVVLGIRGIWVTS